MEIKESIIGGVIVIAAFIGLLKAAAWAYNYGFVYING